MTIKGLVLTFQFPFINVTGKNGIVQTDFITIINLGQQAKHFPITAANGN